MGEGCVVGVAVGGGDLGVAVAAVFSASVAGASVGVYVLPPHAASSAPAVADAEICKNFLREILFITPSLRAVNYALRSVDVVGFLKLSDDFPVHGHVFQE